MKTTSILNLLIAIASISALDAAVNISRNGVTWEGTFEGDTVNLTTSGTPPTGTTPAFSAFDANTNNRSLVGGSLQMVTGNAPQTQSFSNNFGMIQNSLMTAEWRGNVDTNQAFDATTGFGGLIVVADGTYLSFNLYSNQLQVQNSGSTVTSLNLDMTQERTYRIGSLMTEVLPRMTGISTLTGPCSGLRGPWSQPILPRCRIRSPLGIIRAERSTVRPTGISSPGRMPELLHRFRSRPTRWPFCSLVPQA